MLLPLLQCSVCSNENRPTGRTRPLPVPLLPVRNTESRGVCGTSGSGRPISTLDNMTRSLVLCLLVVFTSYAVSQGNVWTQKRKSHKAKSLTTKKLETIADGSSMTDFKALLRPLLRPRVSGTAENKEVRDYLHKYLADLGWHVDVDVFEDDTPFGRKEFANLISTFNPSAPRRLTLACHYDSKYFKDFDFIGATDSAVPCAMLLDIARLLTPSLQKSKNEEVTLQLIFFDGEEAFVHWGPSDSIYGARHLANKLFTAKKLVDREVEISEIEQMDALVLLDLIGTPGVKFRNWFESTAKLFERLKKIEKRLSQRGKLTQPRGEYFVGSLTSTGGIQDDHIPFLKKDVPILHMISYPFPDVWHTANDDESHLNYDTIDDLNKIMRIFVSEYLHLNP